MSYEFDEAVLRKINEVFTKNPVPFMTINISESITGSASGEYDHTFFCELKILGQIYGRIGRTATMDDSIPVLNYWKDALMKYIEKNSSFKVENVNEKSFKVLRNYPK